MSVAEDNVQFVTDAAKSAWESAQDKEWFVGRTGKRHRKRRMKENEKVLDAYSRKHRDRGFVTDAVEGAGAFHLARDLEYEYNDVLREDYAPNSALDYFPVDRSVPVGARSHTVERVSHYGKARVYRGSSEPKGTAGVRKDKERFPVLTYVTEIEIDFFERQAEDFAGTSIREELEIAAQQTLLDFLNEKTFDGSPADDLRGLWDYPYLPRALSGVKFDGSANPDDVLNELHRLANRTQEFSKGAYSSTTMATSIRVHNYLKNTKRSGTTDDTILEAFLADNDNVSEVVSFHEAKGIGPGGRDAMLFYDRGNKMSISNALVQGFQMLPIQEDGMNLRIPCYIQHGGVIMRKPLNNLLAYVDGGS